jgi:putative nucleotidyltransferase with HDIG domain
LENKKLIKSVRKLKENSRFVKEAKKIIYPQYVVKNGIDGLAHIEHVTHIGMEIAERECGDTDTDLLGITLGCLLHDIGRGNEEKGQRHGEAGVKISREILEQSFSGYDIDIEKVLYAISHHDLGQVSKDKLIGGIWDADRLSLYRFKGREIDLNRLSTEAAKELLEYSKRYIAFRMKDYEIDFEVENNFER